MNYKEFASKISFFEFNQEEFKNIKFDCSNYNEEFKLLNEKINIEYLTKILETNPKIIDIFEQLFQLERFTNTQLIHFCFDINLLNNGDNQTIKNYLNKSILYFENGQENSYFKHLYNLNENSNFKNDYEIIFNLKRTIIKYIELIIDNKEILYNHIKNSISSRLRISKYLIENLKADEYLETIDIKSYLKLKRIPIDVKSIHGKFGKNKIEQILQKKGFKNFDNFIERNSIKYNFKFNKNENCYITEKVIEGIKKQKDNRPKKFDFILFINGKIEYLIETNFYSTSGTKIGINQNEYIDLKNSIEDFNIKNGCNLKFMWITDGNYWLTKTGENMFINLKKNHFTRDYEMLNYIIFDEYLGEVILNHKINAAY